MAKLVKHQPQDKLKKTGVLLPPTLTESFEIVLSRVVDLNRSGDQVKVIVCNGIKTGCISNPFGFSSICQHCIRVRNKALQNSVAKAEVILLDSKCVLSKTILSKQEVEELKNGVNSTILTFYRADIDSSTRNPLRRWIYQKLADRYLAYSCFVYHAIRKILKDENINWLEFFNGRIVPTRGALLAARVTATNYGVLEVSGRKRNLTVTENNSVHDIKFKQEELRRFITRADLDLELAKEFFELRRIGIETNDKPYTASQKLGKLEKKRRPLLAIFTSSADELKVAGSQWFTNASLNPVNFIVEITSYIHQRFDIIVRMHPNQDGDKTGAAFEMIKALKAVPNVRVILPASEISSYELLDRSDAVLTFGSTIGLEATYWGKPSILAGRALWDCHDVAYRVDRPEEAAALLQTNPIARSKKAALEVGAYYLCGTGEPGSLGWRHNGQQGYSVNGRNYISLKRSALPYWLSRAINIFLKNL